MSIPLTFEKFVFECRRGTSNKFWEVMRIGGVVFLSWGKISTTGMIKHKFFGKEEAAVEYVERMIADKIRKGYGLTNTINYRDTGRIPVATILPVNPPSLNGGKVGKNKKKISSSRRRVVI